MALHMGVVGYRATSVTRRKQLGAIHDSTGAEHHGKVEEERERDPSHHLLSGLWDFSPFLEQSIDHLLN